MPLTIHHLHLSQSERILWLAEELSLPYTLKTHPRSPLLAPESLRSLHWTGTAPVIQDGDVTLSESGAIVEYILAKYGDGRLVKKAEEEGYAEYLFWLHHANAGLQASVMGIMSGRAAAKKSGGEGGLAGSLMEKRFENTLKAMDRRLGECDYLGGNEVTAADIMSVFSLTTMRLFVPFSLAEYPNIVAYLGRVGKREAYRRAMEKGDPGLEPVLQGPAPKSLL